MITVIWIQFVTNYNLSVPFLVNYKQTCHQWKLSHYIILKHNISKHLKERTGAVCSSAPFRFQIFSFLPRNVTLYVFFFFNFCSLCLNFKLSPFTFVSTFAPFPPLEGSHAPPTSSGCVPRQRWNYVGIMQRRELFSNKNYSPRRELCRSDRHWVIRLTRWLASRQHLNWQRQAIFQVSLLQPAQCLSWADHKTK